MTKQKTYILQGMLDLLVLRARRHGPLKGWDVSERIRLVSGDVLQVIPGSLYPALHKLEAHGLSPPSGARRRTTSGPSSTS